MPALSVPRPKAQHAKERLLDLDLFDEDRRIAARGDRVEIPVLEAPPRDLVEALGGEVVEAGGRPRRWYRDPHATVRAELADRLDPEELALLPAGYQVVGDVALVDLPGELDDIAERVGAAYGEALPVATVLDRARIVGERREPATRHLWGDRETETVHLEHGIAYALDPARVMFSPGNKGERRRIAGMDLDGVRVVDLFAGVGQLALPAAVAGAEVVACETNPTAAAYLEDNAERNGLAGRVEVREGDCREVAPVDRADLAVMGLLPSARGFLDVARRVLDGPGRVWLHEVHGIGEQPTAPDGFEVRDRRRVKSYGPSREHVVWDLEGPA